MIESTHRFVDGFRIWKGITIKALQISSSVNDRVHTHVCGWVSNLDTNNNKGIADQ